VREIAKWRSLLQREMSETAPKAILTLGRPASDALSTRRGLPFGSHVDKVYTAWHPGYVLRNGGVGSSTYDTWLEQLKLWAQT
jgi:hypothetical protein